MDNNSEESYSREKVLWMVLIPQFVLLLISVIWISVFPRANVLVYLKITPMPVLCGILTGIALAFTGYGFYIFSKKTKFLYETVELFEETLAPAFKNLKISDMISLSIISGFCEEIFFRGLMQPAFGMIIASLAFGLLHLPGFKFWFYAIWASLSGGLFGWLFIISHSLWIPITAHAINNIIGMILLTKLKR